ncbi:YjeF N-terminal domain containing protein 3 [Dissostichus eleginoides]|uniref:ApoA-I-binding protein 2 n=1 Tax=Dissostichus eleginoides TaxID=100907 RepID=A0AAD9F8H4_DISEL|nr:YjeF N-terminal domain containing protein 3 [Dissostichus eleginoides]
MERVLHIASGSFPWRGPWYFFHCCQGYFNEIGPFLVDEQDNVGGAINTLVWHDWHAAVRRSENDGEAYPLSSLAKKQPTVLVICGPDQNGSIGLVCARHLRMYEYEPTIYHPKRSSQSLHQDFTVQCEKMDIPSLSYLPTEVQLINDAYNLVIDAMLGPDTDCANIKEPYPGILVTLKQIKVPIASVDVPSGWDAEEPSQDGINPEVLISLTAPKKCAMSFSGKHFLAGRFLPYDIQKKYDLNLPDYPGTDCLIEL